MSDSDILLVEDDEAIARLMELHLRKKGYSVSTCHDGNDALDLLGNHHYRLLILDRMLPGKRGMDLLRWLRKQEATATLPVLMVTALGDTEERIHGLKEGADDYLPKPFEPEELLARTEALLRRSETVGNKNTAKTGGGAFSIDEDAMEVRIGDKVVDLRPLEFRLLLCLMQPAGKVRSREYLLDHVWGVNSFVELRTVDVTVKRLRKALAEHHMEEAIKTIRGMGYRFVEPR